jgi:hypothetical protein
MSGIQPPSPCSQWSQLAYVLPAEQREQLAQLLLLRLGIGWGSVEVIFRDGHIKEFREVNTIPSVKPANNGIIEP